MLRLGSVCLWPAGLLSSCAAQASYCSGSVVEAPGLWSPGSVVEAPDLWNSGSVVEAPGLWSSGSVVEAPGLWSPGSVVGAPGLWSPGSVVEAPGLNCPSTRGILPDQGLNPRPLRWQADPLPLAPREAQHSAVSGLLLDALRSWFLNLFMSRLGFQLPLCPAWH